MRPLSPSNLDSRVEKKSILILDITLLYLDYVEGLVPANISSKQGKKQLPQEIWCDILRFATWDDNSHEYRLVQPQSIERSKRGSAKLLCAEIPVWNACGLLEDPNLVCKYEYYLARPHGDQIGLGNRPFSLPGDKATVFTVPTAALGKKILFERVTVPDVISWMERGECCLCGGGRVFCVGCNDGREVAEQWTWSNGGDCSVRMLCPLCIGTDFANKSISWQYELLSESSSDNTGDDEYDEWAKARFVKLGYW